MQGTYVASYKIILHCIATWLMHIIICVDITIVLLMLSRQRISVYTPAVRILRRKLVPPKAISTSTL